MPDNQFSIHDKEPEDGPPPDADSSSNIVSLCIVKLRELCSSFYTKYTKFLQIVLIAIPVILIHVYLILALEHNRSNNLPFDCCNGVGFLVILYAFCVWAFLYYFVIKRVFGRRIKKRILEPASKHWKEIWSYW